MRPASAFVARTNRHFSETGFALAFSVIAFRMHLYYRILIALSTDIFPKFQIIFGIIC